MWNTERFEWVTPKDLRLASGRVTLEELIRDAERLLSGCVSSELQLSEQDKIWLRSIKVSA
jgi:hypothetical protein